MRSYVYTIAMIVGGLVCSLLALALWAGVWLALAWLVENWFWPLAGIVTAVWFFSAPFKRVERIRVLWNLNPIAWILGALVGFSVYIAAIRCSTENWEHYLAVAAIEFEKQHYETTANLLLEAAREVHGPLGVKHLALANLFRQLGHQYHLSEKRYDLAATHYQRAIYLTEEAYLHHSSLGALYLELGQAYRKQGDLENAEAFMRKALAFEEKHTAKNTDGIRVALSNLAAVLDQRDKGAEAETFYLREIQIMEQGIKTGSSPLNRGEIRL